MQRAYGFSINYTTGVPTPGATVTVFDAGTLNVSTFCVGQRLLLSTHPVISDGTTAIWFFYAANGRYDVQIVKAANPTYSLGDVVLNDVFSLNGLTGNVQTFATGTAGTDFAISSVGTVHTFNIPSASGANRGLVTTGAQTFAGLKTFTTPIAVGSGGLGISTVPTNGQIPIGNGTNYVAAGITGTPNQITVTPGAGSITLSAPQDLAAASSPTFTGLTLSGLTTNRVVLTTTAGQITQAAAATDGQVLIGQTGAAPVWTGLTAGSNITITTGAGSITIASTAGITSLNGLTTANQVFAVGTSGADLNISSSGSTHTINLPDASATNRGAVTTGTQTFAGTKTFSSAPTFGNQPTLSAVGGGSGTVLMGGTLNFNVTSAANVGGGETDLMTYSLPAGTLNTNGKAIRITAFGQNAANANSKQMRMYFGATVIENLVANTSATANTWWIEAIVARTGATAQRACASACSTLGVWNSIADNTTPAETLANAITVKVTGQGVANNDIIQYIMCVEILN